MNSAEFSGDWHEVCHKRLKPIRGIGPQIVCVWKETMRQSFFAAALAATLGLMSSSAVAGLIVTTGNNPQTDDNVIANGCSAGVAVPGPALTVKGCFNANHGQPVDFTSSEAIKYTGGQAAVVASDGAFATLTISVED